MMDKIKRREFMKLAGIAVFSPSLLKSKELTPGLTNPVDIFQDITGIPDSPFLDGMRKYCNEPIEMKNDYNPWNPANAALRMMFTMCTSNQKFDYDSFVRWARYCDIYSLQYRFNENTNTDERKMIEEICKAGEGMIWFTPDGVKGLHYEDPELTRLQKKSGFGSEKRG